MIDVAEARDLFDASTDGTVGIEEEFALLDHTLRADPGVRAPARRRAQEDPLLRDAIAGELISSEIEIRSGRGEDFEDARRRQHEARRRLFTLAAKHDVLLGATGTHPLSDYREQHIIDTPHYRRVEEGLKYVAWRNNTFSLHVHVGIQGADRAVRVCDRLRPVLPLLLAIAPTRPTSTASTPACTPPAPRSSPSRSPAAACRTRSGPGRRGPTTSRCSCARTRSSSSPSSGGRSARTTASAPSRCACATPRRPGPEADALAQLIVGCVNRAAAEVDAGEAPPDLPGRLIEENMWRALRYGLDGNLLDLDAPTIEEFPAAEALDRLKAWSGVDVPLPELNGAQRQRRMIDAGATPEEVYAECVKETQGTYQEETVT